MKRLAKSYLFQVFRHRLYLPFLNLIDRIKDLARKVNTQQYIELNDLGLESNLGSRYESISYSKLKKILNFALKNDHKTFLDIGCGLGRPIIVANEVGFKDLYGVDISENLISKCASHLQIQGCNAQLSISDISNYELPSGRICIFMFNPFGEERMKELLNKIYDRQEDSLILYHNPRHSHLFNSNFFIKKFLWKNFGLFEEKCHCYLIPGKGNP
tara:strand:- start:2469 stop:3113 length:645 start_codon:yes stop_codon:yes gene_type:complete